MKVNELVQGDLHVCSVMSNCYDPVDWSLPGFSVHGIVQARILEWVAILFPGDLPDPGIELGSPALQADSLPTELSECVKKTISCVIEKDSII